MFALSRRVTAGQIFVFMVATAIHSCLHYPEVIFSAIWLLPVCNEFERKLLFVCVLVDWNAAYIFAGPNTEHDERVSKRKCPKVALNRCNPRLKPVIVKGLL